MESKSQTTGSRAGLPNMKGKVNIGVIGQTKSIKLGGTKMNPLPSKVKPLKSVTSTTAGTTGGPKKASGWPSFTAKRQKGNRQIDDLYDNYLMNFLCNGIVHDLEMLSVQSQLDIQLVKLKEAIPTTASQMTKYYADQVVIKLWEDLKQVAMIGGAFNNLIDFVGEETLAEIEAQLVKKFEKITVEGATVEGSLFEDMEVRKVLESLQSNLTKVLDASKLAGFIQIFDKALRKLMVVSEKAMQRSKDLEIRNKIELENCSLAICSIARESYLEQENREELDD